VISGRMLGAIAAIVVLGGGGVAFVVLRAAAEAGQARADLIRAVDVELGTNVPDRDELGRLVKELKRAIDADPHAELIRALARVQRALGRAAEAWATIEAAATQPGSPPEDVLVGAQVLADLHAETGELARGQQARGLARTAFELDGRPGSAFLAWQCAYRTDDVEAWIELDEALARQPDSLEARTARVLGHHLALCMVERLGIEGGVEELQSIAAGGSSARLQQLCRFVLDTRNRADELTFESLDALDREWGKAPP